MRTLPDSWYENHSKISVDSGWIEWDGSDFSPVPTGTEVEVKFRMPSAESCKGSMFRWNHENNDCDIVAYKVIEILPF